MTTFPHSNTFSKRFPEAKQHIEAAGLPYAVTITLSPYKAQHLELSTFVKHSLLSHPDISTHPVTLKINSHQDRLICPSAIKQLQTLSQQLNPSAQLTSNTSL
jgi:hypothetical protein